MPARESALVKRVKAYLRSRGAYVVKTCPPMEAGTPDLLVCWQGRFVGIELKAKGQKPTALQCWKLSAIQKAGGFAFWADNLESVIEQLGMLNEVSAC